MDRACTLSKLFAALAVLAILSPSATRDLAASADHSSKFDRILEKRALLSNGRSRVIIQAVTPSATSAVAARVQGAGGTLGRRLRNAGSQVAIIPNSVLSQLAEDPLVSHLAIDRLVTGTMERSGATIGATAVRETFGYDGSGIGVALIDSGVTSWHDDLGDAGGVQRVDRFVDFVNGREQPYDDYGHGTHVAGIVAGNGYDSGGARSGIAPAARLIVLKVLDEAGKGYTSDVIAAIDYAIEQRDALNIRVMNLSVAAGVYESYSTDPLALAAQRAVNAGIVVVGAAGNNGHSPDGYALYGGITAPGNAPWVLTVGASSHMGTIDRADDRIAGFTSRGPTAINANAKPDIVAPGVGIESLADPNSALYSVNSAYLLNGTVWTSYLPYMSLSGTSMAAPVVTGTVALMLQANPALTPNAVKAILEYTAETRPENDPLTEGAGYLNAKGAVELARYLAHATDAQPDETGWSRHVIWGNRLVERGWLTADANAWALDVTWGAPTTPSGDLVRWGEACAGPECTNTHPWEDSASARNVVWGSTCGGADCASTWTLNAVAAAADGEMVVWGTGEGAEMVVWGTADGEMVVWGTDGGTEMVVWGTSCTVATCTPVIWNHQ